jgi:hypothetical protein
VLHHNVRRFAAHLQESTSHSITGCAFACSPQCSSSHLQHCRPYSTNFNHHKPSSITPVATTVTAAAAATAAAPNFTPAYASIAVPSSGTCNDAAEVPTVLSSSCSSQAYAVAAAVCKLTEPACCCSHIRCQTARCVLLLHICSCIKAATQKNQGSSISDWLQLLAVQSYVEMRVHKGLQGSLQ